MKASANRDQHLDRGDIIGGGDLHIGVDESLNSTNNKQKVIEENKKTKTMQQRGRGGVARPSLTPLPRLPTQEAHRWPTDIHPRLWPKLFCGFGESLPPRAEKHGATNVEAKLGVDPRRRTLIKHLG